MRRAEDTGQLATAALAAEGPAPSRYRNPGDVIGLIAAAIVLAAAVIAVTVAGGCITYQFSFVTGAAPSLAIFVDEAIAFEPRSVLVDYIRRSEGLALCGRGAACPG